MHFDLIAIPDAVTPQAVETVFQHLVTTYAHRRPVSSISSA